MVTLDGWRVEPVAVQVSLSRPARQMLRVKHGPYWVADCRSIDEVATHVDLASLMPEAADFDGHDWSRFGRPPYGLSATS